MLEKLFRLSERNTSVRTEVIAGFTTFMTMAYILAVNPDILSAAGMDASSVFAATALSAAIGTLVMGLCANLPVALAPGMGLNAFFAFVVVLKMGHTWQFALTAVFLEGLIFILLTMTNLREAILNCIPNSLKKAISAGIGLFIAFIGLQSAQIIVNNDATLVSIAHNLTEPGPALTIIGVLIIGVLLAYKVKGALLIGIVLTTLIGIPLGVTNVASFDASKLFTIPSVAPTFMQFEWDFIFTPDMLLVLSTFLFVDLFDTVGALIGVATKGKLLDSEGKLPNAKSAFMADAIGTSVGAALGTSTVTSFVESAAGVAEGGRTGLTAVTVAVLFLLALLISPLFLVIPTQATAPALILVGLFMMSPILEVDFNDYTQAIPAFLTLIIMPFAYSISEGIIFGLVSFVVIALVTKKTKELTPLAILLTIVFVAKYLFI